MSDVVKYEKLQSALTAVDDILDQIAVFDNITSEEELDQVMPDLLASLGKYSLSDRAYIFFWDLDKEQVLRMTHEWCKEGVEPTIGIMQDVHMSAMPHWSPRLHRGEAIVSMDWERDGKDAPEEYALFSGQDIHALIVIPILSSRKLIGYIGFDNPEQSQSALSVRLLTSVGGHVGGLKEKLLIMAELEKKQRSLECSLEAANLNSEIVGSISKIYWLIYRMDLIEGTYEEISAGQEMHRLTGKRGIIAEAFKDAADNIVAREHQKMMERFLDTSTLPDRLKDTESIAVEYQAASGSWHLARFIVKRRDEQGKVTNVLYVVRQIDKQKQIEIEYRQKLLKTAEEARRANIAKTDFLRRMSHDIRTPINGIQGMITIAEHYPDDMEKQKECRDKVKEASGFLLDLVNSILDMNKLESGAVVLEHKPFDLIQVLKEVNSIIEMNSQQQGLSIHFDHSKIKHTRLMGSPVHFKQILQNIAGNAVKYNREGGSISLSAEEVLCENGKAFYKFICSDTGRGMSKEFLQHAFEPFAQENTGARTSYMGTGLGLAITKQLVEMMDGSVDVKSEKNVGSTFSVLLPFELDTSFEGSAETEKGPLGKELKGLKVLLTEDNELNIEIAQFILENAGMYVTVARNGKEAVDLFGASAKGWFDLILMDVMMPVMDGLTAARTIRAMDRDDAKSIPIFAMTANAFREDILRSKEAGMDEHLSKPIDEEKVLKAVHKHLFV